MLPNMTSSKSSRSSLMPSSLSLSALRSSPHLSQSQSDQDPGSRPASKGNKLRRKSGIDFLSNPSQRVNRSPERQISPTRGEQIQEEPVPPQPLDRKARTWSDRISTFLPSLITNDTDPQQTGSVRRKPVGSSISSATPPPDSAPPPYRLVDPHSPQSPARNESIMSPTASPPVLPPRPESGHVQKSSLSSSMSSPLIETQIPTSSFSTQYPPHPQIMAPTPPSPETRRATLLKQEPAAKTGTQRSSTSTVESSPTDNSPRQGKLQKENHENRSRRNSLQQPKVGQAHDSLQTAVSGQSPEQRGRRAVSAQSPSAPQDPKVSRISSLPVGTQSAAPRTADGGSQSPSRGRLRRSWLPGGRSRSNSVDVTGKGGKQSSYAWMADESQAEYNTSFLKNGEKVSSVTQAGEPQMLTQARRSPSFGTKAATSMCSFTPEVADVAPHSR